MRVFESGLCRQKEKLSGSVELSAAEIAAAGLRSRVAMGSTMSSGAHPDGVNQEKALAGITNALQAHPEIGLIFSSSDLLLPSISTVLRSARKYRRPPRIRATNFFPMAITNS